MLLLRIVENLFFSVFCDQMNSFLWFDSVAAQINGIRFVFNQIYLLLASARYKLQMSVIHRKLSNLTDRWQQENL